MPDRRKHRGPHPADGDLFAAARLAALRTATVELSWLRARGYADTAALKLVGDRHALRTRQRHAIRRSACTDVERSERAGKRAHPADLRGRTVALDGFNCVIALEAALSGAPIIVGRDGVYRDLSSVHGSYRTVEETRQAVTLITALLQEHGVARADWYLDRPVSNSGRLKLVILEVSAEAALPCTVELVDNPDRELIARHDAIIGSGDGLVLDGCSAWIDIPATVLRNRPGLWLVDLTSENDGGQSR